MSSTNVEPKDSDPDFDWSTEPPPPRALLQRRPRRSESLQWRAYNASNDFIARVNWIQPAVTSSSGRIVTVGRGGDNFHISVTFVGRDGYDYLIVVCHRGWLPLGAIDPEHDAWASASSTHVCTTSSPPAPRNIQLSSNDRKRIAAAILGHFLGPLGSDRSWRWPLC